MQFSSSVKSLKGCTGFWRTICFTCVREISNIKNYFMKKKDTLYSHFRLFYTGLVQALRLNNAGQKSSQLGQMINLMQVDAQKFQVCFSP